MALGQEIRRRRRELDLTQMELAKITGCHPVTIHKWERGEIDDIGAKNIVALERALNYAPGELLKAYCNDIDSKGALIK